MSVWPKWSGVGIFTLSALLLSAPAAADPPPQLWGVDEDDGMLFSLDDYETLTGLIEYGTLKFDDGSVSDIGAHIEAFTLDSDGTAYMAVNADVGSTPEPVLLSFDIANAHESNPNIVTVLGTIGTGSVDFDEDGDNISGLSIQPGTRQLYALFRRGGDSDVDRLLVIDKSDGSLVTEVGAITGSGEDVGDGEDIEFDSAGNLYATDNDDDELYLVNPATAAITAVIDDDQSDGDGIEGSVKFESLGWHRHR
jgi:hypothetical protein